MVFQDYLLFPHLCVRDNVAFGLRSRGCPTQAANRVAMEWLERFGLGGQGDGPPAALSGGSSSASRWPGRWPATRVLLLDEPLAALDVARPASGPARAPSPPADFAGAGCWSPTTRSRPSCWPTGSSSSRTGRCSQAGTADEIRMHPRSDYIARLVGVNLLRGSAPSHVLLPGGAEIHLAEAAPDGEVFALVRPQAVALFRKRPDGTPRNVWLRCLGIEGDADG